VSETLRVVRCSNRTPSRSSGRIGEQPHAALDHTNELNIMDGVFGPRWQGGRQTASLDKSNARHFK